MLDQTFKVYLIEWNSNPALLTDTKVQSSVIPQVMEHAFDIVLSDHAIEDKQIDPA